MTKPEPLTEDDFAALARAEEGGAFDKEYDAWCSTPIAGQQEQDVSDALWRHVQDFLGRDLSDAQRLEVWDRRRKIYALSALMGSRERSARRGGTGT